MKHLVLVFLGGGAGSLLRYLLVKSLNSYLPHFFVGTFLVNSIGSLLIGFLIGLSFKDHSISQNQMLLLSVGFCGGFTTFSAFAFEEHTLLNAGELLHFAFYTGVSLVIGILAVAVGLWLARAI